MDDIIAYMTVTDQKGRDIVNKKIYMTESEFAAIEKFCRFMSKEIDEDKVPFITVECGEEGDIYDLHDYRD